MEPSLRVGARFGLAAQPGAGTPIEVVFDSAPLKPDTARDSTLKCSPAKSDTEPLPTEAKLRVPGFALA